MSDTDRNADRADATGADAEPTVPGEAPVDPAYAAGAGFTGEATAATPPDQEATAGPDPLGSDQQYVSAENDASGVTTPVPEPTAGPDPLGSDQPDPARPEVGAGTASAGAGAASTANSPAPRPQGAAGDAGDDKTMVIIAHAANIIGVFTGGLGNLAALILAYVKKDSSPDWARSHFVLVIRTVFIAFIASIALIVLSVVAFPLLFVGVGFAMYPVIALLWLALSAWVVVRSVVGLLKATREEAYPNPETWLI